MKKGGDGVLFLFYVFVLSFFSSLVLVDQVFCYDTTVAHPGIAGLAVKAYNKDNSQKISAEQYEWIKQGAIEEDTPTRWLNHFYDPVYNRGLWFGIQHETSKSWAQNPDKQQSYSKGDKTFQRAVNDYRSGNYEVAFKELGHSIHLVSDLSVPAHTRDDIHAPKPDSYEEYVKNNWDNLSKDINVKPIYKGKFDDVFDESAKYTNNNFYSDDTVESDIYNIHLITKLEPLNFNGKSDLSIAFSKDDYGNLLASHLVEGTNWKIAKKSVNNTVVLSDYAHNLLPKAVAYSAGTIKLFLDETKKNQTKKSPFFRNNLGGLLNSATSKVINVAENLYNSNSTKASTNNSVLNKVVDATVSKIETIGRTLNDKKIPINSSAKESTSAVDPSPVLLEAELPVPPIDTVVKNVEKPSSSSPVFYGGGGSHSPSSNFSNTAPNNSLSEITTTSDLISSATTSVIESATTTTTTNLDLSPTSTESVTPDISSTSTISTSTDPQIIETVPTSTTSTSLDINLDTASSTVSTTIFSTTTIVESPTTTVTTTTTVEGNTTTTPIDSSTTTVSSTQYIAPDVVINEVAWAGTSQFTPEDEYIELFNNSDKDIELFPATDVKKWWKIKISGKEITIKKINNSIIQAHGYYLLENPDDRTVNEISGDIIYAGSLSNNGENLELFDSNNLLVDKIDSSSGWFAGSEVDYVSMEKIDSSLSGDVASNWQANQGPRFNGKVDGGGDVIPLNGSPKQSNFGSIVLRGTQTQTERTLPKSDYQYILTYYEIPAGKTLNIEAGSVLEAYYPDSKIEVKGNLNIKGSNEQGVIMTSDKQLSKSWQGMMFYPGSVGNLNGLNINYAGKSFGLPNANMWDPKLSAAVYTNGAGMTILNSNFVDSGDIGIYSNNSNSSISNTNFSNGVTAIEHHGGQLNLDSISVDNFSNSAGAVYVKDIWPQLSNVVFSNNVNGAVNIALATITSSVTIGSDVPINLENPTIERDGNLTIDQGVTINLPQYSNIFVKGALIMNGTQDKPIKFTGPIDSNKYWGHLVFDGGRGNLNSVNFSGGGYNSPGDGYKGVISVNNNSQVTLENCQLLDNRLPVEIIQINDSAVNLNNTSLGYTSKNTFFPTIKGVKVNTGALSVDNSFFYNLTEGISAGSVSPLPQLNLTNMDTRNFINVDNYWSPSTWLPAFTTST